jgi:hypothetical protein
MIFDITYKETNNPVKSVKIRNEGFTEEEYVSIESQYSAGVMVRVVNRKSSAQYFLDQESLDDIIDYLNKMREEL